MKNRTILMALAALLALAACSQKPKNVFDRDNNDKIEYVIDYTVHFAAVQCPMQWCETDLHDCKRVLQHYGSREQSKLACFAEMK